MWTEFWHPDTFCPLYPRSAAWQRPSAFRVRATYAPASGVHKFRGQDSVTLAMLVATIGSIPERSQQGLLSLEGEEQKVDHPERRVVGTEGRSPRRVTDDRYLASLHG